MDKKEILEKASMDNKGMDIADLSVQQKASYYAYFVGIIGIILVNVVNSIIFKYVNHGPNMIMALMLSVAFTIKYIKLKKKHELVVVICYYLLTIMFLVFWILQLLKVW